MYRCDPTLYNVTVNPLPVPAINGPAIVCQNTGDHVYTTDLSMTNYLWSVSPGGTITAGAGTNSITVSWNIPGVQTVSVDYMNANGCTAATPTIYNVIVNPFTIPVISGPAEVCVGSSGHVYSAQAGMTGYSWTVSAGGTITAGAGTNSITVSWATSGAKSVNLTFINPFGCTSPQTSYPVIVDPLPVPSLNGPGSVCVNAVNTYTTEAGMNNYVWTITGSGGSITSGAGTNTVTVIWTNTVVGSRSLSVTYVTPTGCIPVSATLLSISILTSPLPSITGPTTACMGNTLTYQTQSGQTNYIWTVSAGGVINSGLGTNLIQIVWNTSGTKTVTVNYTNSGGCSAATPSSITTVVNPSPVPTITGPVSLCTGSLGGVTYTTEAGMTAYSWAVSAGGSITAGQGTRMITVSWTTSGAKTVMVNYTNASGCPAPSPTVLNVNVYTIPVATITGSATGCVGVGGYVYTTEPGMTNYVWGITAGGTITGGQGTNSITVTWTNCRRKKCQCDLYKPGRLFTNGT